MVEERRNKFCSNCGAEIDKNAEICPKCGVRVKIVPTSMEKKNTGIAAVLSVIFPGLGQIYNGQIDKGILFLIVGVILAALIRAGLVELIMTESFLGACFFLFGFILYLPFYANNIYDAYATAKKINAGEITDIFEEGIIEKADVGKRFVSYLIDAIILGVVGVVLSLTGEIAGIVMNVIISATYFTYLFGRGQTLGMMAMKIKLIRTDGTYPIGYLHGFLRYVGTMISALVIGIGYLWIVIDKDNQGWHDKIADTYVVPA